MQKAKELLQDSNWQVVQNTAYTVLARPTVSIAVKTLYRTFGTLCKQRFIGLGKNDLRLLGLLKGHCKLNYRLSQLDLANTHIIACTKKSQKLRSTVLAKDTSSPSKLENVDSKDIINVFRSLQMARLAILLPASLLINNQYLIESY